MANPSKLIWRGFGKEQILEIAKISEYSRITNFLIPVQLYIQSGYSMNKHKKSKNKKIQTPHERKAFSARQKTFQAAWENRVFELPKKHMKRPIVQNIYH